MNGEKSTPMESVHKYCRECVCGDKQFNPEEVRNCTGDKAFLGPCPMYPYRMGTKRPSVRRMREFCIMCCGHSAYLVVDCPTEDCQFHPYRMGKNPARKGKGNPTGNPDFGNMVQAMK